MVPSPIIIKVNNVDNDTLKRDEWIKSCFKQYSVLLTLDDDKLSTPHGYTKLTVSISVTVDITD